MEQYETAAAEAIADLSGDALRYNAQIKRPAQIMTPVTSKSMRQ